MPKRGRGDGGSGQHGSSGPHSVRQAETELGGKLDSGRSRPDGVEAQPEHLITQSTGEPLGVPDGSPTRPDPHDDAETKRSIRRENDVAVVLAGKGFRLKQNPSPLEVAEARRLSGDIGDPSRKPDYLVEGRVFDCYSPTPAKPARGVWTEVEDKVKKGQTQRVVVDLAGWAGDMSALRKQFVDWPIQGLKEVKALMPDGNLVQITLPYP